MSSTPTGRSRKPKLGCESLEDRSVPAAFVPWSDPSHLTLSFAPDGTAIAGHTSSLFQLMDARKATASWERSILLAFQTWAVNANINVGVVADGGQAFGVAGATQDDPRFGDIRIGAQPMSPDALAITVPNDPAAAGTLTGDVFVNSDDNFATGGLDVFAVLLHEAGHAFGLDDGTDPNSPMYSTYRGTSRLTAGDIATLRSLYGARSLDANEGSSGNDTTSKATTIPIPGGYTGATPLVAYGDVSTNHDVDVFSFRAPSSHYRGSATIRLQSSGISLLAPRLTILDSRGHVVGTARASSGLGDVVTLSIGALDPGATYYAKVQGATSDAFGIGSYGLAVTFNSTSRVSASSLDSVLRGPYQSLSPDDIVGLLTSRSSVHLNDDHHSDDDQIAATRLTSSPGYARNSHYETIGSLSGPTDVDHFRFATADKPSGNAPLVLTVNVRAIDPNGVAPRVAILDRDGNPVPSRVVASGGGMFTVQAVGVKQGGFYLAQVSPAHGSGSKGPGNYALTAQFGTRAADLTSFADSTVGPTSPTNTYNLYVGQTQLMHLVLSADANSAAPAGSVVRMTIRDRAGRLIYGLTARAGDVAGGPDLLLTPGAYTVRITAVAAPGRPIPTLAYHLLGAALSDPIGPVIRDPTLNPLYTAPGRPGWFSYPGANTLTQARYLFLLSAIKK